jgi:hypothetical protein
VGVNVAVADPKPGTSTVPHVRTPGGHELLTDAWKIRLKSIVRDVAPAGRAATAPKTAASVSVAVSATSDVLSLRIFLLCAGLHTNPAVSLRPHGLWRRANVFYVVAH